MISRKGDKIGVDEDDMLEIIDDRFPIQEVVGNDEEVPAISD